jgi:DNA-binding transcriptional regulator GbsR (MarR family)
MKLKDIFAKLAENGKITNDNYKKFLEALPDVDAPDDVFTSLEEKYMTPERAASHPEVVAKLRWETLNPINRELEKLLPILEKVDKYTATEISALVRDNNGTKTPDTYKQLGAIGAALPKLFEKLKVAPNDEDSKKVIEEHKRTIQELTEKFTGVEEETKKRIQAIEAAKSKEFNEYKLNKELESMVNSYTFAEGYQETKPALTKAILGELKSKNILALATKDNGEEVIEVQELHNGTARPKFNGNTPVVIKNLLDEAFTPFLKKNNADSNGGDQGNSNQGQSQSRNSHNYKVDDGQPVRRQGASVQVTV